MSRTMAITRPSLCLARGHVGDSRGDGTGSDAGGGAAALEDSFEHGSGGHVVAHLDRSGDRRCGQTESGVDHRYDG